MLKGHGKGPRKSWNCKIIKGYEPCHPLHRAGSASTMEPTLEPLVSWRAETNDNRLTSNLGCFVFFCSKLCGFLHGNFISFKEHCPKVFFFSELHFVYVRTPATSDRCVAACSSLPAHLTWRKLEEKNFGKCSLNELKVACTNSGSIEQKSVITTKGPKIWHKMVILSALQLEFISFLVLVDR